MENGFEGSLPAVQLRSEQTRDKLIAAGYDLCVERPLPEISVADIAERAGVSVGAFYRRFENKEAFEAALVNAALQQGREVYVELFKNAGQMSHDALGAKLMATIMKRYLRFAPIYRSAIIKSFIDPQFMFAKQHARFIMDLFLKWAETKLGRPLRAWEANRIKMTFQALFGTIANALAGRPGPIMIEEKAFSRELTFLFLCGIDSVFSPEKYPRQDAPQE